MGPAVCSATVDKAIVTRKHNAMSPVSTKENLIVVIIPLLVSTESFSVWPAVAPWHTHHAR